MARGRPPKLSVLSTGKIGKEKIKEKQEKESKLQAKCNLKPPTWLSKNAKTEFNRIVKALEDVEFNLIDNLDLSILAIYAQAYSQYLDLTEEIKNGDPDELPKLYRNQKMQIDIILQCSSKLGLAISDRLRLVVPTEKKETNPFLQFLDEK